ncbi:MAG: methyltransferase domain-containing protein [Oscillospiraceae bacterium]|nr:methyltransferase domain-containing protein [Oscillospiraceae bacterium]
MFNRILQNTRKPQGFWGRMMLFGMNNGHKPLSDWAMPHLPLAEDAHVLDVGCGGGANLAVLLKRCPKGRADGLDHSAESVAASRKKNARELGRRCAVTQGDVGALPYGNSTYDAVTAFETVYFWPDLPRAFSEILRVLKPGGRFLLACEMGDASDTTWTSRINGMTVYTGEDLKARLEAAGFINVKLEKTRKVWFCMVAQKPA